MIAGQPTTLTFSLVAPPGVTYQSPVVTVEENPWATSSTLTDNGNGTYSITVNPDRETNTQIRLKAIQGGKTYYHTLNTLVTNANDMKLKVTNTTNYLSTSGAASVYFNFSGLSGDKVWDLSTSGSIIDRTSMKVSTGRSEVTLSTLTSGINGTVSSGYMTTNLAWPTAVDQTTLTWEFDATHPLSGVKHHFSYATPLYKAIIGTFVTNETLYLGIEKLIQFTLKFASGNVPTGIQYSIPHTITGGTATGEIITIDASQGLYGIKVTPTAASVSVTVNYAVGNSFTSYQCGPKVYSAVAAATATLPAMSKYTRDIGIVLKDGNGFITDATITGIAAGSYVDASTGSWTVTDASKGLYRVQVVGSTRGAPANTNTTPKSTDSVIVTFTRGSSTYHVPMSIDIYWAAAKVSVGTISSTGGSVILTPVAGQVTQTSAWVYTAPTAVYGLDGVSKASGGAIVNNIGTAGTLTWTAPAVATGLGVIFGTATFSGNTYYYWSDPFTVTHAYTLSWTPVKNNQSVFTGPYSSIPAFDFTDIEVTITDDLGALVTDAVVLETPVPQSKAGVPSAMSITARSGMTLWAQTMVPKTDGSDGKYLLKLHWNTYNDVTNTTSYWIVSVNSPSRNATTRLRMDFGINRAPA